MSAVERVERWRSRCGVLAAIFAAAFVLPAVGQIRGTMSDFDVSNGTNRPVTNLELDLRLLQPLDVRGFEIGPGDCP